GPDVKKDQASPQPDTGVDTGIDTGSDRGNVMPDATPDGDAATTTPDGDGGGTTSDGDAASKSDGDAASVIDSPADRADSTTADVSPDRGPDAPAETGIIDARTEEAGPPVLVSIDVTPTNPSIAKGTTDFQFTATGKYSDNSTKDLTNNVTWQSLTTAVATI